MSERSLPYRLGFWSRRYGAVALTITVIVIASLVLAACGTTRTDDLRTACQGHGKIVALDDNIVVCEDGFINDDVQDDS